MRIPPLLHHVHLPTFDHLLERASGPEATFHLEWALSCQKAYPDFLHLYWDYEAARKLVEMHYPAFLPVWQDLPWDMHKADAIRYLIMHRFGGVYMDADVACYRPAQDMLAGYDVGTADPEYLASAVLASAPGHPLWTHVVELLEKRYHGFTGQERAGHVLDLTGPFMLRDALKEYLFGSDAEEFNGRVSGGVHEAPIPAAGSGQPHSLIRIHELGTFFTPCFWYDEQCHKRMARMQRLGTVPVHLAGYHLYRGSWWGNTGNAASSDGIAE
ncbi:hypothetical protein CHLNCDRAFT_141367 [Chlorella variabilis]|uniref:Alpha 1,4-glycosyltransferase domain-containing protein n=1 Tax=Chlorella variabilis TaxID=554065 RepID=E1ZSR0_CHLVA|nr:hypothetical protein CHLNCDRAFT_141367 [Chlorella variabilis]EFN51150.1 hypothetical protein CHLNCDRAFT_141367 [Chlorella variabilis]|eukprot:XP_005843252.1 hypothetical protein CHLNCDRAFT_141367 [Chlorella variabilis]